jgi:hypothetical protein
MRPVGELLLDRTLDTSPNAESCFRRAINICTGATSSPVN